MPVTIEFDPGDIEKQLGLAAKVFGVDVRDIVHDEMYRYTAGAMRVAAPGSRQSVGHKFMGKGSAREAVGGTMLAAKKVGQRRVAIDLNMLFVGMDAAEMEDARVLGGGGPLVLKRRFKRFHTGAVWLVDADVWAPGASIGQMRKWHNRHRSKKTGRVSKATRYEKNIGHWTAVRKLHVPEQAKKDFVREQQRHVGKLKAGWTGGMDHWGKLAGRTTKAPRWVLNAARAGQTGDGFGRLNSQGSGDIGSLNNVPYAPAKLSDSTLAYLGRNAQKSLMIRVKKQSEKMAERFNKAA